MTDIYKKRAKGGWNCGKKCKDQSNRNERQYAKEEVKSQIKENEKEFKHKRKKGKKKLNLNQQIRQIKNIIKRCGDWSKRYLEWGKEDYFDNTWCSQLYRREIRRQEKYIKKLEEIKKQKGEKNGKSK